MWREPVRNDKTRLSTHNDRRLYLYIFDCKVGLNAKEDGLIHNCNWHNFATLYYRETVQDQTITVTLKTQSRAFPFFVPQTTLSTCVCCFFNKTNKGKQSWNSD